MLYDVIQDSLLRNSSWLYTDEVRVVLDMFIMIWHSATLGRIRHEGAGVVSIQSTKIIL
jgi:hypothetical protein